MFWRAPRRETAEVARTMLACCVALVLGELRRGVSRRLPTSVQSHHVLFWMGNLPGCHAHRLPRLTLQLTSTPGLFLGVMVMLCQSCQMGREGTTRQGYAIACAMQWTMRGDSQAGVLLNGPDSSLCSGSAEL